MTTIQSTEQEESVENYEELTEKFLKHFDKPCFGLYDDRHLSTNRSMIHIFLPFHKAKGDIKRANNIDKRGIFFTPNGEYQNASSRNIASGKTFSYLCLDFDAPKTATHPDVIRDIKEEILKGKESFEKYFLLPPATFLVETKRGYHIYYRFSNKINGLEKAKYKKLASFCLEGISKKYKDDSCTDISRFFRLPGYKYWKDNTGETIIKVVDENLDSEINFTEVFERLRKEDSFIKKEQEIKAQQTRITKKLNNRLEDKEVYDYFDNISKVSIRDVLTNLGYRFSGNHIIDKNGEITDGWRINIQENYVNNFTTGKVDRPVGEPWSFVLKHFRLDRQKTFEFFDQKFGIKTVIPEKEIALPEETRKEQRFYEKRTEGFTYREDEKNVFISDSETTIIFDKKNKVMILDNKHTEMKEVANFYIEPIALVVNSDSTSAGICLIRIYGNNVNSPIIPMPHEVTPTNFEKAIREYYGIFKGMTKNGLSLLTEYIFHVAANKKIYTNNRIGFNSRGNFVTEKFVAFHSPKPHVIEIEKGESICGNEFLSYTYSAKGKKKNNSASSLSFTVPKNTSIEISEDEAKAEIRNCFLALGKIYASEISYPLALSALLGLVSPYIRRCLYKLPYCFLFGLTQSGKTTVSDIVKERVIGDRGGRLSAMVTTNLPFQEALKQGKPVFVGEFRTEQLNRRTELYTLLRNLYDGTETQRGRSDLSIVSYPSVGNIIMDGEHIIEDQATFSRGIFLHCRPSLKRDISRINDVRNILLPFISQIFRLMKNENFWEDVYVKKYFEIRKIVAKRNENKTSGESERVIDNFSMLLALGDFIGLNWEEVYEKIKHTIQDQLSRVSKRSASKTMLWTLGGYIEYASKDGGDFLNCASVGDGKYQIHIKTNAINQYLELNRKISTDRLDTIIEALHGEDGIYAIPGLLIIESDTAIKDTTFSESILETLKNKGNYGSLSNDDKNVMALLAASVERQKKDIKNILSGK